MFRQPEETPPPEHSPQQPDMTKLLAVGQVLAQGGSDDTEQLILALKPHLSAARAERAAKAARMLHLWHMVSILRESGLIGEIL